MFRMLLRLALIVVVGVSFLLLYRPDLVTKASNALLSSDNGGAVGSAQYLPGIAGKSSSLQLSLQGLISHLHYVVTLNQGSCSGKVLATVGEITADQQGNAVATMQKTNLDSVLTQGVWINVHKDSASGATVACGQVQTNSTTAKAQTGTPATVPLSSSKATPSSSSGARGFPQTGAPPANDDSYDNYTFPRKY